MVIELADEYAPHHAANIRLLAKEGYWNGLAILRSQENYVVQWGDPNAENPALAREIERVEHPLGALHRERRHEHRAQHLPARACKPEVGDEGVPRGDQCAVEAEHFEDEICCCVGFHLTVCCPIDSLLSMTQTFLFVHAMKIRGAASR